MFDTERVEILEERSEIMEKRFEILKERLDALEDNIEIIIDCATKLASHVKELRIQLATDDC